MSEVAAARARPGMALWSRLAQRPALVLLLFCLVVWLPGALTLPPLDRDESRFAQATKQMVETGDFVDIRFSTGTRYNKPVGIYWLQAAATEIFGGPAHDRIWTYRLPSLLGGYLALLLAFFIARTFLSPETALAAAGLLGSSVLMTAETQIATTDAVLLAATLGAQAVLFRKYLAARGVVAHPPGRIVELAGWFALAVGILVKGPVVLGVLAVTALAISLWDRDWRWLKDLRYGQGVAVIALVVLPWAIAIAFASHGSFYKQSLGHDFASKLVSGQESHGAPPGYYLLLASLTFWPATLFVLPSLRKATSTPAMRYLVAWAGASWLLFECVPTKLPHYILPAYPALAIIAACWVFEPASSADTRTARLLRGIAVIQFVAGVAAFLAVTVLAPLRFGDGIAWPLVGVAALGAAIAVGALVAYARDFRPAALLCAVSASAVLIPLLTTGVAPRLGTLWLTERTAALVAHDRRANDPPPVIAGYVEPSLIFRLGSDTRVGTGGEAARIAAAQGGLAAIEDRERGAFLAGLGMRDTQAFAVDALTGVDYSRGRPMHITIYRVVPATEATPPAE